MASATGVGAGLDAGAGGATGGGTGAGGDAGPAPDRLRTAPVHVLAAMPVAVALARALGLVMVLAVVDDLDDRVARLAADADRRGGERERDDESGRAHLNSARPVAPSPRTRGAIAPPPMMASGSSPSHSSITARYTDR